MQSKTGLFILAISIAAILSVCGSAVENPSQPQVSPYGVSASAKRAKNQAKVLQYAYRTGEMTSPVSISTSMAGEDAWPMVAANPQRTSWTPEEVRGQLQPVWYRSMEPYINYKVQIIAAYDTLYISTARGLYALSTEALDGDGVGGDLKWVYPTELPLGHSPTVVNGVAYVGGYDRKIHAFNATPVLGTLPVDPDTGYRINDQVLWTFDRAEAGFETNPLVIGNTVYAGNRDGCFYALDATTGELKWKYQTNGPILYSAAYQGGTLYFASNDSHAYALSAATGQLLWKSQKLPGAGFHSYWPVVYQDYVIFSGSNNYSLDSANVGVGLGTKFDKFQTRELYEGIPSGEPVGPIGTEPGDWAAGTVTIDASRWAEHYENKPWQRTYFALNRFSGQEFTFDSDGDGEPEYAPIGWCGTASGNRYPPVIGSDGVLYQHNSYVSGESIAGGGISGWKLGTPYISRVSEFWYGAVDEPMAASAGGNLLYQAPFSGWYFLGSSDIHIPLGGDDREWGGWRSDAEWYDLCPGIGVKYVGYQNRIYGSPDGVYSDHGVQNPPIPYRGKVYLHARNSIIAFASSEEPAVGLPLTLAVEARDELPPISIAQLRQRLASEVQKMLAAGHLRPGYHSTGWADLPLSSAEMGYLLHYFHNPAETLYTLVLALPHLPAELEQQAKDYLQQEFARYPGDQFVHVGWLDGAAREVFEMPPEIDEKRANVPPNPYYSPESHYHDHVYRFYGLWRYAQVFGNASGIFEQIRDQLRPVPGDEYLTSDPYVHNAYIAGYVGYLELQKMAGYPESTDVRAELDRLLELRATTFSKDLAYGWEEPLNVSANFMYLVPELADYLHDHAYDKVREAVDEYQEIAPGWFVSKYDATGGEGALQVLFDYHSILQAKALILHQSREELAKYLDVPAFATGDLFYIQNLVATIEAPPGLEKSASRQFGDQGDPVRYTVGFSGTDSTLLLTDTLPLGVSMPTGFELQGTSVVPTYHSDHHRMTWSDVPSAGQGVTISYTVTITTGDRHVLVNTAELLSAHGERSTATATVVSNPRPVYLLLIIKDGW